MTQPPISRAAAAKLAESGISAVHAKALGIRALTAAQAARDVAPLGIAPRAGMLIPYHDAAGEETGFFRYRYLDEAARVAGAQRYSQTPGSGAHVYLPRVAGRDWAVTLQSVAVPLLITEGELKAACACLQGFPTLGLGGVWSWRSSRDGQALLQELEAVAWPQRDVYVVFDSDLRHKPQVRKALLALADTLTSRGAIVHEVVLPDLVVEAEDGSDARNAKVGLDDYLVARGAEALAQLLEEARPLAGSRALWDLSREVVYVRDPGLIVELATGARMSPRAFTEHAYAHRTYTEQRVDAQGRVRVAEKPLAKAWISWPHRAEAPRLVYEPGAPRLTDEGCVNLWRGWGVRPEPGDTSLWQALVKHLLGGDTESIEWLERWCAYPVQHPGTKLLTSVIIWGVAQGTGKSLLGYTLGRIYGAANFAEIQPSDLQGVWNDWQAQKQFVMGDEIAGGDRRSDGWKIKRLVTSQTVRVQQKYVPTYEVRDCANYYWTSNHPDPFSIEVGDRRFAVWEVPGDPLPASFYAEYDQWLRGPGPSHLMHRLLHDVDCSGWSPNAHAPTSASKRDMLESSVSDLEAWLLRLLQEPDVALRDAGCPSNALPDLLTAEQLLALYDKDGRHRVTATRVGIAAKRMRLPVLVLWGSDRIEMPEGGRRRLYVVRNREKWAGAPARAAVVAQLERQRGSVGGPF